MPNPRNPEDVVKVESIEWSEWCCYLHRMGGDIVYIGSGRISRAFSTDGRTPAWLAKFEEHNRKFTVELITVQTELEARLLEILLQEKHKPEINRAQTDSYIGSLLKNVLDIERSMT